MDITTATRWLDIKEPLTNFPEWFSKEEIAKMMAVFARNTTQQLLYWIAENDVKFLENTDHSGILFSYKSQSWTISELYQLFISENIKNETTKKENTKCP